MNAKVIDALKGIRDEIDSIIGELEGVDTPETTTAPAEGKKKSNVVPMGKKSASTTNAAASRKEREAAEKLPDVTGNLSREQLDSLSYNNLKKLAKEMGLTAVGDRDSLTEKILNTSVSAPAEEEEKKAPANGKKSEAPTPKTSPRKLVKKNEEPEPEEEEAEEEVDPIVEKVNEAVADMSDEDIMDFLADVGVKAKGKRQALIAAVIKAVKDGKIELDDDDSEEEEADTSADVEENDSEEEVDPNDLDNEDMTDERRAAIEAFDEETRNDFAEGNITRQELVDWLNEYHNTKDKMEDKSDEELLDEYIYYSCLLINDEGEMSEEEGAYTVNGVPYCCGHALQYNEDNNTFSCEHCGEEYEAGE